jgi:hypothetical protein
MATGRDNKLVGALGEYLVAAERCRRGLIATTFTGNVPFYDVIASDEKGRHVSVQVEPAEVAAGSLAMSPNSSMWLSMDKNKRLESREPRLWKDCLWCSWSSATAVPTNSTSSAGKSSAIYF